MTEMDLAALRPLARQFPTPDAALAEVARLSAELTLPKGTVHVISDVHGDDVKLRHVINNASGTLRPLVERLFGDALTQAELQDFLALIFYPRETLERLEPDAGRPGAPAGLLPSACCRTCSRSSAPWPRGTRLPHLTRAPARGVSPTCCTTCCHEPARAGRNTSTP